MSETKHTPGPWRVSDQRIVSDKTNVVLAETHSPTAYDPEHREQRCNARLIAAAPELLQAATAAWHLCESLLAVREGASDDLIREVRDAAKAAVEKAGGES